MEKFQGPTNQCFGGNLGVDEECHGNTGFNFSYGAPYFNLEGESFTIQGEQQQQSCLSISVPITNLEDKMPFLEMLKSVDSPYYPAPVNPHFRMLLKLQQQQQHHQERQIPGHFSGSSSSDQSSMDYYYSHQMEAPQPVAFEPQSCVIAATTTKEENLANSSVKSEDNKEKEEQEHMEQLGQDHAQAYYLSLHLESNNNENNNGELGGEPPNYSSPECLNCRQTVSSPTTTCCLAETESISPRDTPSRTKSASKPAPPAARLVTSSTTTTSGGGGGHEREKKKRKRTRPNKNREEVESQRMTHIAVERNRRRQMNDHLNALRSLMPPSFVQRGDQASIIGGAIDFVKELEQLLQSLEAKKSMRTSSEDEDEKVEIKGHKGRGRRRHRNCGDHSELAPFLGFFSSPQYTSYSTSLFLKNEAEEEDEKEEEVINEDELRMMSPNNIKRSSSNSSSSNEHEYYSLSLLSPSSWLGVDIEVAVVQTHVNLKILGPRRTGQLVRVISALEQDLRLTIMHLNVTSFQLSVLYSFNLKIEDDCKLGSSADEIATAVYQIFSSANTQLL